VKPQTDPLRARADELQQGPQIFQVSLVMNVARFPEPLPAARGTTVTFGVPSPKLSASLQAVNIVATITGPAGPARDALVGLIDRAYFESLLNRPLPEVTASTKRIDNNIAQAASAAPLAVASSVPLNAASTAVAPAATAASPTAAPAPGVTPAASAAAASTASAAPSAQRSAGTAPCPPPTRTASSDDAQRSGSQVGSEVGGAVLGGGWGRSVGASVGGVLGALGGSAKKAESKPTDCPR
jgi:hypothetical protein